MNKGKCKDCGKKIYWVKTAKGRTMPCEAQTIPFVERGDGELLLTGTGHLVRGVHSDTKNATGYGYRPHRFSCNGTVRRQKAEQAQRARQVKARYEEKQAQLGEQKAEEAALPVQLSLV